MPLPDMTAQQFVAAAQEVAGKAPSCALVKNEVGNLAIFDGETYTGFVNLRNGEVTWFADDTPDG